jgi:hypothetical protein
MGAVAGCAGYGTSPPGGPAGSGPPPPGGPAGSGPPPPGGPASSPPPAGYPLGVPPPGGLEHLSAAEGYYCAKGPTVTCRIVLMFAIYVVLMMLVS